MLFIDTDEQSKLVNEVLFFKRSFESLPSEKQFKTILALSWVLISLLRTNDESSYFVITVLSFIRLIFCLVRSNCILLKNYCEATNRRICRKTTWLALGLNQKEGKCVEWRNFEWELHKRKVLVSSTVMWSTNYFAKKTLQTKRGIFLHIFDRKKEPYFTDCKIEKIVFSFTDLWLHLLNQTHFCMDYRAVYNCSLPERTTGNSSLNWNAQISFPSILMRSDIVLCHWCKHMTTLCFSLPLAN